ncbi:RNA-binding domain-containing protein [Sphingobacterium siyangense]|uniref:RNA-binding domain-containing protein n=1 Tax=Sphingobacterium siyangense TaxID=459529 RepID=UPI003DA63F79
MSIISFVNELVRNKNSEQVDFLTEFDMQEVLRSVCSFLNSDGGWIVVGHNGLKLIGIDGVGEDMANDLKANIYDRIIPQPLVYTQLEYVDDKGIILLNVMRGSKQPYSFDRKYYVREDNSAKEANRDDVSILLRTAKKHLSTWEKQTAIDAHLADLEETEISKCISSGNKLGRSSRLPDDVSEFLGYFDLSDYTGIKNGAVVLFGKRPTEFLFQCRIRIIALPEGRTGDHFADTLIIEDNLFEAFDQVSEYFTKRLPMLSEFKDSNWNRRDNEKYPVDALDEAIVNAMVHRDYGDAAGDITINIFHGKIEIINSGEIPADILNGKSTIKAHHSVLRNPTIAHMFYLRGKMEKLGRGLALIKERFKERKLPTPEWTTQSGYTKLTLFGEHEKIELNERMKMFLDKLKVGAEFTSTEYLSDFGIAERTARKDISALMTGKWISKVGDGPTTKYKKIKSE